MLWIPAGISYVILGYGTHVNHSDISVTPKAYKASGRNLILLYYRDIQAVPVKVPSCISQASLKLDFPSQPSYYRYRIASILVSLSLSLSLSLRMYSPRLPSSR